jgi:hypothetical protein
MIPRYTHQQGTTLQLNANRLFPTIQRLDVDDSGVISRYEHEASQSAAVIASVNLILCNDWLARPMKESCYTRTVHTSERSNGITAEQLARNWNIPLERAKRTLAVTTQRGVKTRPTTITRRFKTNDRMLRYNRLNTNMFTDTIESGTMSRKQNKFAQVFVIPPNWTKLYSMRTKGEAHHCLSSLFHEVGVREKMIMDGSKEQTQGEFRRKLRDAGCFVHQTVPILHCLTVRN